MKVVTFGEIMLRLKHLKTCVLCKAMVLRRVMVVQRPMLQ